MDFSDLGPMQGPDFSDLGPTPNTENNGSFLMSPAAQQLGKAQGPSQMLAAVPGIIDYGAQKVGDFVSQQMQQGNIDPSLANVAGKVVQYAPDIAMAFATPLEATTKAMKMAMPAAQRYLGIKSAMLQTPFARGQAALAAKTALEQNIIPTMASPQGGFDTANLLKNATGKQLENIRNIPANVDSIFDGLEQLRQQVTEGVKTGKEDVHAAIDKAQNKLLGLFEKNRGLSFNDVEGVKSDINDSLNYLRDTAGDQKLNKNIVSNIESNVENLLGKSGINKTEYKTIKTKFSAAKTMLMGLNKEIAQQEGNNANGLLGIAAGAAELGGEGSPLKALAAMGLMDLAKRRGWGLTANVINAAGNNVPGLGVAASLGLNQVKNNQ